MTGLERLSIVIPVRNGAEVLRRYLGGIGEAAADAELLVVDDGSTEDVRGVVEACPAAGYLRREGPNGFCYAVNEGVEATSGGMVMVLNSDVVPEPGSFEELVSELSSAGPEAFSAVPSIVRPDGTDESLVRYRLHHGLAVSDVSGPGTPYPSGACSVYRRETWLSLGGYDSIFAPIYWEDADLGARAFARGLRMIRCATARVRHEHAATMSRDPGVEALREMNRLIFTERHFRAGGQRVRRRLWLAVHLLKARVAGNDAFLEGWRMFRSLRFDAATPECEGSGCAEAGPEPAERGEAG